MKDLFIRQHARNIERERKRKRERDNTHVRKEIRLWETYSYDVLLKRKKEMHLAYTKRDPFVHGTETYL